MRWDKGDYLVNERLVVGKVCCERKVRHLRDGKLQMVTRISGSLRDKRIGNFFLY